MQEIPKDVKCALFLVGAKTLARMASVAEALGFVCLIMAIISGAMNKVLGLAPSYWFLMTVAFWVYGFWSWLAAYFAAKEG
jgi:hypothetical protein